MVLQWCLCSGAKGPEFKPASLGAIMAHTVKAASLAPTLPPPLEPPKERFASSPAAFWA